MDLVPLPSWLNREEFPFQPKFLNVGQGEALSVTDEGSGEALVFSHGTPSWSYEWRHHLRALSASYRVIAPDHLGFGLSPRPREADYSPEAHARRFERLLEALPEERYSLVAHDYGGLIGLAAALHHPERVKRLVLYNTFSGAFGDTPERARLARLASGSLFRFLYRNLNFSFFVARSAWGDRRTLSRATFAPYRAVFSDADSRELVLFALARALAGSAEFAEEIYRGLGRFADIPVHMIWGMKDTAFPKSSLERLRAALPNASVLELERAGHFPHEEEPERCVESVRDFLART